MSETPIRFSGYSQSKDRPAGDFPREVGPGTPGGEYFRRFWHPFLLSEQLKEGRPKA